MTFERNTILLYHTNKNCTYIIYTYDIFVLHSMIFRKYGLIKRILL